jgi:endonuclease/exonuclease/phosphatase family metal-dependent hydrolase
MRAPRSPIHPPSRVPARPADPAPPSLRAMTYNIHSCIGIDRQQDPERIVKVLELINADIVALQEVRGYSADNNQFQFLSHRLTGMNGVFGNTFRPTRFSFGNALFVRGEILETRTLDLSVPPYDARGGLDCTVSIDGARLRVITVHLGLFPNERLEQLARLKVALESHAESTTVILGDFNIFGAERRRLYRLGAPKPLPKVRTFPAPRPIMSLDRIWSMPGEQLLSLQVWTRAPARWASDHLPLVGEIALAPVSHRRGRTARVLLPA